MARQLTDAGMPISDVSIGRYEDESEKGRDPALDYVRDLAKFSGVSLVWLVTGDGDPYTAGPGEAEWRIENVRAALEAPYGPTASREGGSASAGPPGGNPRPARPKKRKRSG